MAKAKKVISIVCSVMVLFNVSALGEAVKRHNPLIDPQPITTYVAPVQNIKNILLLGIDKSDRAAAKGFDYHTDAIMVVAVNLDENRVDLVSLPRDTLTYVPGIKGIYKLNAAINCGGGKTEEGFQKVCEAAAWVLGGIKIDHYFAVDMKAMEAIGNAIGGVDFVLEMSFRGAFGSYSKGLRHLNGKGIVDYLRARRNATVNANDIGRTGRQRELMAAIFEKIMNDKSLVTKVLLTVQKLENAFFTNMSLMDMTSFLQVALKLDKEKAGSHVITGKYRTALKGWNFTFTNQEHRREVIKQVYGVDVPELKYVSLEYTKWLVNHGFTIVRYLSVAELLRKEIDAYGEAAMSAGQKEALAAFDLAYAQTQDAFDAAADSMAESDAKMMAAAGKELRARGDALYRLFEGVKKPAWTTGKYWYADRMINEIDVNFR